MCAGAHDPGLTVAPHVQGDRAGIGLGGTF
jgi:hypothetical protein